MPALARARRFVDSFPRTLLAALVAVVGVAALATAHPDGGGHHGRDAHDGRGGPGRPPDGQHVFRFDTFGDEAFWTDHLKMNAVIGGSLDPVTALGLGLKVDADALPPGLLQSLTPAQLTDPQTTLALIQLDAVVGVRGTVAKDQAGKLSLTRVGITCALCHSTVDDSAGVPGIGRRLDGWPNRDLDPGRSSPPPRRWATTRRRCTGRGGRGGTTRGSTSTARAPRC